jgi:hypothetical protein
MIKLAGITSALPKSAVFPASALPVTGDLIRFPGVSYKTGELMYFRVDYRTHKVGNSYGMQLTLSLLVAHQP